MCKRMSINKCTGLGINISSENQIIWNWQTVLGAAGYKWNTTNSYNTSTDNGLSTSYTQTGLVCILPISFMFGLIIIAEIIPMLKH